MDRPDRQPGLPRDPNGDPRGFRDDRSPPQPMPALPPIAAEGAGDLQPAVVAPTAGAPTRRRYPTQPAGGEPRAPAVSAAQPLQDQPEFLRRPVRRPRREEDPAAAAAPRIQPVAEEQD
ncbi:MAG: hypothetical protein ACRCS9_12070 [Hyphomicrobium sp.]